MGFARSTVATVLSWLLLTSFCAAQSLQVVGDQPGVGPICMGPIGPAPCVVVQQYITRNRFGVLTPFISTIENSIRHLISNDIRTSLLGKPNQIRFSEPITSQGLTLLTARVIHELGWSEWRLGLISNGSIVIRDLVDVTTLAEVSGNFVDQNQKYRQNDAVIRNPGQLAGGSNNVINSPGQILGGQNSVFNNPGQIFTPTTPTNPTVALSIPDNSLTNIVVQPPQVDSRVVEFLIATTRKIKSTDNSVSTNYSGERADLSFGAASVRIPEDHKIGHIELPDSWSLFGLTLASKPSDREHFIIKRITTVSEDKLGQIVRSINAKSALIFVHGFNTSFEDSIMRNAQIIWDLQFRGLSVLFSWASRGDVTDYIYDKESAYLARGSFIKLVEKLRREYGIDQINILAHSMGNLITLDSLANYAQTSNPVSVTRFMMAAPDVDRDQFIDLAPKAKLIVGGITLYASSADRALALSRRLAGNIPRAGDVPLSGPIQMPGVVDTIDVTAVGDDVLGLNHNAFAASRNVMEDISAMIKSNQPPPRLSQIRGVPEPPSTARYWRYVK